MADARIPEMTRILILLLVLHGGVQERKMTKGGGAIWHSDKISTSQEREGKKIHAQATLID